MNVERRGWRARREWKSKGKCQRLQRQVRVTLDGAGGGGEGDDRRLMVSVVGPNGMCTRRARPRAETSRGASGSCREMLAVDAQLQVEKIIAPESVVTVSTPEGGSLVVRRTGLQDHRNRRHRPLAADTTHWRQHATDRYHRPRYFWTMSAALRSRVRGEVRSRSVERRSGRMERGRTMRGIQQRENHRRVRAETTCALWHRGL